MYRIFLKIISSLKWTGGIYFVDLLIGDGSLHFFIYFWLFGLLELILTFPIFVQSIYQIIGLMYIRIQSKGEFPSIDNYTCKNKYILPFNGKWTVVNGGVLKEFSHSWGIYTQRYAYDFIVLDKHALSLNNVSTDVNSYYCYNKDILACADGEVVAAKGKYRDSYVNGKKVFCDSNDLRGNFITIKHDNDEYSTVAHLKKGSITVNVGDKVAQGQVIGKCGNSGNTSQPHLHFQLHSTNSFFSSFGLPIAFYNIDAEKITNYSDLDNRSIQEIIEVDEERVYIGRGQEVQNKEMK